MVHDFVKQADTMAADVKRFFLSPARWSASKVSISVNWSPPIPFTKVNSSKIPAKSGVYAFIVRHVNNHFPDHGFIMYIGITGANNNGRTLKDRYSDYLREIIRKKRPKIHYMLNKYPDDLHFTFSEIDPAVDLEALELDLNDAILPPVVIKDFSAEIRELVKVIS